MARIEEKGMYKAAKVEQSDTKWKWKNHHHNSKAVRKRFSIFFTTLHCTIRLYGVHFSFFLPSLSHISSVRDFIAFHFSFLFFPHFSFLIVDIWPSLFQFLAFSSQLKQKSFLNAPICCVLYTFYAAHDWKTYLELNIPFCFFFFFYLWTFHDDDIACSVMLQMQSFFFFFFLQLVILYFYRFSSQKKKWMTTMTTTTRTKKKNVLLQS